MMMKIIIEMLLSFVGFGHGQGGNICFNVQLAYLDKEARLRQQS